MEIRKISIGSDYKGSSMHYILGQEVLNGTHVIHLIDYSADSDSYRIYVEKDNEVFVGRSLIKTCLSQ